MRKIAWFAGALSLVTALGCVGELGNPPDGDGTIGASDDPGRVTMHRLNRAEYNNTVRDLLGTQLTPADDFPADDVSYGFDNISDVLTTSPLHVELYERSAEKLIEEAMSIPTALQTLQFEAEALQGSVGQATATGWLLWSNGEVSTTAAFPSKGEYRISARVWGAQAGPDPAKAELLVGGVPLGAFDVPVNESNPMVIETVATIEPGTRVVSVGFVNDFYDQVAMLDRNLYVDWVKVEGPLNAPTKNPQRDRIVSCDPASAGEACVKQILSAFGKRAFRRPLSEDELTRLLSLVNVAKTEGDTLENGLKVALRAILVSPHFVFRVELDPDPNSASSHPLNDFELASRLSYFIWSSMPDDELLAAAEQGKLSDENELGAQVARMLDDPKAEGFIENFAGQWLTTRSIDDHEPDYVVYPSYNEALGAAMKAETKMFFREFLMSDRSLKEMLTADFTFANQQLAEHYGLQAVSGEELQKVSLAGTNRKGILTQGSLLTVTSHPTRTSPVKRGKWVLTQLLCSKPPDPPAGVEGIKPSSMPSSSLRDLLEEHRQNPVCASCHDAMDPIGFGLENYDGVGAYRTSDTGGFAIDSSGELPTGEKFNSALELADLIASDPRYSRCVTRQVFTYALGRGVGVRDFSHLDHITQQFDGSGSRLKDLIQLIVKSEPFRLRRGEPVTQGSQP